MAEQDLTAENLESAIERRNILLKDVDPAIIRKAWFILSHMLLEDGARVADMGCDDGAMTYAMAAMAPKIRFAGIDKSKRQISKAKEKYQLHNLEYKIGDAASEIFAEESLDAIINSYVLHEVYSASRYNERIVGDALRRQFRMLKKGGAMFIQDFASPPPDEFVLLEVPDALRTMAASNDPAQMSDPDLLVWYSQYARPKQDPGCTGFFLEELPARFPRTRLFRLPHKWAYEFLMRKDNRARWDMQMPMEYTFYTPADFKRELRGLGARVQYSAPYWDEEKSEKSVRLFSDDGAALPPPAACYIIVAYKMAERRSLNIEERRPSTTKESRLKITAMRDQKSGKLTDVVSRGMDISEIVPYYIDEEGQLKIYLHDGVAKSIVGAVPRSGANLDERNWSGHMVEALAVPSAAMAEMDPPDTKSTILFARDHISLRPQDGALLEKGPDYYPSPEYIDERIYTFYLKVEKARMAVVPKNVIGHDDRFQAKGLVREFDAQQILNAISVGMIPNARLELQILSLFNHLNIKAENWTSRKVAFEAGEITGNKSLRTIISSLGLGMGDGRFREVKGSAGQLRGVHSTFVEEGQTRGAVTGLSAQDVDFVIYDDRTVNTAAVLPLTLDMKGEVHAAFLMDKMPVPERRGGNGITASAMTFNLPPHVTNMELARKFVAEKFSVLPEMVIKLGECYFTHIGITPQKIYPFAISMPAKFINDPNVVIIPAYQAMLMSKAKNVKATMDTTLTLIVMRAYRFFNLDMKIAANLKLGTILKQRFAQDGPDWGLPLTFRQSPISHITRPKQAQDMAPLRPGSMGLSPEWDPDREPAAEKAAKKSPVKAIAAKPKFEAPIAAPAPEIQYAPQPASEPALAAIAPEPAMQAPSEAAQPPAALPSLLADFEKELEEFFEDLEGPEEKQTLAAKMVEAAMDGVRIFDRARLKNLRGRRAAKLKDHDFLFKWAARRLDERLDDVRRNFPLALQIGARALPAKSEKLDRVFYMDLNARGLTENPQSSFAADEEFLPVKEASLDLVIANMSLHAVNDLPGALLQIKRALKPDGLFIAAMFGGETLHELRASLTEAELEHKGGASPRVFPFADKQQMGALMQRAGFALPVVDSEIVTVTYADMFGLLKDLRGMGEGNIIEKRLKKYPGREFFFKAAQHYAARHREPDNRVRASFEIIFLAGWAPHESQQQPLKPGSATKSLAEALETQEIKTDEKASP